MAQPQTHNVRQIGDRIEYLLDDFRRNADPASRDRAEELVGHVVELYGAGLERIVEHVAEGEERWPELVTALVDDELVASLLVLHGLHPLDVETRVQNAVEKVRPYLGSSADGVEFLGVDEAGIAHLRIEGSCNGCPSSTLTVKQAVEGAIMEAAPEITRVDVDDAAAQPTGNGQIISLDSLRKTSKGVAR